MADLNIFLKNYKNYMSSFKETSYDNNNKEFLCKDTTQKVIGFDKIIKDKYPNSNERPKSFDAIYIVDKKIFLIEFKNQKPSDIDNSEVQDKMKDGIEELKKVLNSLNISLKNYKVAFCLVYKKCKEPFDNYKCGIGRGKIKFGLDKKKSNLPEIDKIFTENVDFFRNQIRQKFKIELSC